jgi:hypothetical protein
MARSAALGLLIAASVLAGCGGGTKPTAASSPSPTPVSIDGTVTVDFDGDKVEGNVFEGTAASAAVGCGFAARDFGTPQIRFRDGEGNVVGTTTGGELDADAGFECTWTSPYTITVPKADFYEADLEGADGSSTVSYSDLTTSGFRHDFTVKVMVE